MSFSITKKYVPASEVLPQMNHSEYKFYGRDVDFLEYLQFLPFTPVVQLPNGKYMVWSKLDEFYLLKMRYKGKEMPVYVLEDLPLGSIFYLQREGEHPLERTCNILKGLFQAEAFTQFDITTMSNEELESFYQDYAEVTEKPIDFIRRIDVLRKYYDEDVCSDFINGKISLDTAIELTFEVRKKCA